jgi:hypothetical protein
LDGTQPNAFVEQNFLFDTTTNVMTIKNSEGNDYFKVDAENFIVYIGAPSCISTYETKSASPGIGTTNIYSAATASYSSLFFEYYIKNGSNLRAGNIVAVWDGINIQFTEFTTMDIGDTTTGLNAFTFSVVLSTPNAVVRGISSLTGWKLKSIIRTLPF